MTLWSENFSVGDEELDSDHQFILSMLQELQHRSSNNLSPGKIIVTLRDFANRHFQKEEGLMLLHGYPRLEEHQDQHRTFLEFLETLDALRSGSNDTGLPVSATICQFLEQWIGAHTLNADQAFGAFLKSLPKP